MRLTVAPPPEVARALIDRQRGHGLVMSVFPDGMGSSPRAEAKALWRWYPHSGHLHIQAAHAFEAHRLGAVVATHSLPVVEAGSRWRIDVEMNCEKTPPSQVPVELRPVLKAEGGAYRSRKVVVPLSERYEWAAKRLARYGFVVDPESLRIGDLASADLGRRGRTPYVRVTAVGSVVDPESWSGRLVEGIGAGKSFGLGLIEMEPMSGPCAGP